MNRQKPKTLDSKGKDVDEDNGGLDLLLPAGKTVCGFEERLEWLQKLCVRKAKIVQRQFELSHTREEVQNNSPVCIYTS